MYEIYETKWWTGPVMAVSLVYLHTQCPLLAVWERVLRRDLGHDPLDVSVMLLSVMIRRLDLRSVSSSTAAAETRVIHYIAQWQSLCCFGLAVFGCRVGDWNLLKAILVWVLLFQLLKMTNCWICFVLFQWNITHVHCYSTTMTIIQHTVQIRVIKKKTRFVANEAVNNKKKGLEIK